MSQSLLRFVAEEDGQDLIEYSLLMTFIAIACMAFLGTGRPATSRIWGVINCRLDRAHTVADGG